MVRPAEHRRDPGVRRDARELGVRVAGRLEDDRPDVRVVQEPVDGRGVAGRRGCASGPCASRENGRSLCRKRETATLSGHSAASSAQTVRMARCARCLPLPAAPGAPGEDRAADGEERPGLVVELEDRVHPLQVGPVAVLEVDELAAADHPEAEQHEERGEDAGAVVARRRAGSSRPPAPRAVARKSDDGQGGRLRARGPRRAPPPAASARPRSRRRRAASESSAVARPEAERADGEEDSPDAERTRSGPRTSSCGRGRCSRARRRACRDRRGRSEATRTAGAGEAAEDGRSERRAGALRGSAGRRRRPRGGSPSRAGSRCSPRAPCRPRARRAASTATRADPFSFAGLDPAGARPRRRR